MNTRVAARLLARSFALILIAWSATTAAGSSVINVGSHLMDLNDTQTFDIYITGNDSISALDLAMIINGGFGPAPVITAVDIVGPGTLFYGNNTGQFQFPAPDDLPGLRSYTSTTTNFGAITLNGSAQLLARVTVQSNNVIGAYWWSLALHPYGSTNLGTDANGEFIYPEIIDGVIIPDPEPSSFVLGLLALATTGAIARRRRTPKRCA